MVDDVKDVDPDGRRDRAAVAASARARLLESLLTNPFWAVVVLSGGGFAITCLMSVAATMGDPRGPMNQLVTAYGTTAVTIEAATLILAGLLAMTVDRVQTLRRARGRSESSASFDPQRRDELKIGGR